MKKIRHGLLALGLASLLTSCAELAPSQEMAMPTIGARVCHERITLSGRFSISYRKDGRDESAHGSFTWVQNGDDTKLSLMSPLGQILATIAVSNEFASLSLPGQSPRIAPDVDALAASSLGWPLPVSGLRHWLFGCALDGEGQRIALAPKAVVDTAEGWRIAYPVWEAGDAPHPRRIDIKRTGETKEGEISMRIVIDTWQPRR